MDVVPSHRFSRRPKTWCSFCLSSNSRKQEIPTQKWLHDPTGLSNRLQTLVSLQNHQTKGYRPPKKLRPRWFTLQRHQTKGGASSKRGEENDHNPIFSAKQSPRNSQAPQKRWPPLVSLQAHQRVPTPNKSRAKATTPRPKPRLLQRENPPKKAKLTKTKTRMVPTSKKRTPRKKMHDSNDQSLHPRRFRFFRGEAREPGDRVREGQGAAQGLGGQDPAAAQLLHRRMGRSSGSRSRMRRMGRHGVDLRFFLFCFWSLWMDRIHFAPRSYRG